MKNFTKKELCTTVRVDYPCIFMHKEKGCLFNDQHCRPVVSNCFYENKNCEHITAVEQKQYCSVYMHPKVMWSFYQKCPLATHLPKVEETKLIVLDPRKAAKQRRKQGK